jgi:glycosyltransferase involved in cell wall biosynthesis
MSISVALCTYNGAEFLAEQLESLAAQRVLPDELVVCDDASPDGTVAILRDFASSAAFPVRIHVNPHNLGYVRNFEQAISLCTGELIALCDQDDVWHPEKLARSARLLADLPEIGLVCTDAEVVGRNLEPLGLRMSQMLGFGAAEQASVARGSALEVLVRINFVTGAATMFRSGLRAAVLPIPDGWVHDGWIALMISLRARVAFIDAPLLAYRQHGTNRIGAPPQARLRDALSPGSPRERSATLDAERWQVACERAQPAAREADLALLAGKQHHTRLRAELPAARLPRLPRIAGELLRHNYQRYSAGAGSALKDLLAP